MTLAVSVVEKFLQTHDHSSAVRAISALELWHKYTCQELVHLFLERDDVDAAEVACEERGTQEEKETFVTRLLSAGKFKHGVRLSRQWGIGTLMEQVCVLSVCVCVSSVYACV